MRRALMAVMCAAALSGCGDKTAAVDPNLCYQCREIEAMGGDTGRDALAKRGRLEEARRHRLDGVVLMDEIGKRVTPQDCPDCRAEYSAAYERNMRRQGRK